MWIVRAEFHQVGIVHPSTVGTLHHGRLFFCLMLLRFHNDVRLPNAIRKAAMLVTFHDVLHWDISADDAGCSGHPYDGACPGLTFSSVGDVLALLEVAEGSQGPVQVLKLLIERG